MTLLAGALAIVATACGGGNNASIPPAQTVDKSTAISEGDSVCTALAADQKQLVDTFKQQHPNLKPDDARDFLINTLSPRIERAVGDFHRIGEPSKDRTDWDTIVRGLDKDLSTYKADLDTDPIKQLDVKPFKDLVTNFDTYGFRDCGRALA